jgi:hypothetical protein
MVAPYTLSCKIYDVGRRSRVQGSWFMVHGSRFRFVRDYEALEPNPNPEP